VLPATDYDVTWTMLILSGVFFTAGSLAFVRAFEEPPKQPLFYYNKHFQTDELLGAWFFLFGTLPAVPYCIVFFLLAPSFFYFASLIAAIVFVLGCVLFVLSCYPNEKVFLFYFFMYFKYDHIYTIYIIYTLYIQYTFYICVILHEFIIILFFFLFISIKK
jgi:hypothetical protein